MISLIEMIPKNLGYPHLVKVNPNTQDISPEEKGFGNHSLVQAALPSLLCAIFNVLHAPGGNAMLLDADSTDWLDTIFGKNKEDFIRRISEYSGSSPESSAQEARHIASEAIRLIRESLAGRRDAASIHSFAAGQKHLVIQYLPASLQMGDLLHDGPLDDQTHKMQGPISNLMHSLETAFD
jgi:hypothetical protein